MALGMLVVSCGFGVLLGVGMRWIRIARQDAASSSPMVTVGAAFCVLAVVLTLVAVLTVPGGQGWTAPIGLAGGAVVMLLMQRRGVGRDSGSEPPSPVRD